MRRVAFGLGANLGDRIAALQGAVDLLAPHLDEPAVSSVYESSPVGGVEQPDYANAVLVGGSDAEPSALLELAHEAEQAWHRTREVRWGPRTLDVDVLVVGDVVSDDKVLTLPHPRIRERGFVLLPWAEVDPAATLPDGTRVVDLAAAWVPGDDLVARRDDVALVVAS
ncbi:MAG: 2-amino-4-hydroxy-6-hydroxymethyldihydropteridine diphosphokinase [Candidatus Nanopelagicales bacterium]